MTIRFVYQAQTTGGRIDLLVSNSFDIDRLIHYLDNQLYNHVYSWYHNKKYSLHLDDNVVVICGNTKTESSDVIRKVRGILNSMGGAESKLQSNVTGHITLPEVGFVVPIPRISSFIKDNDDHLTPKSSTNSSRFSYRLTMKNTENSSQILLVIPYSTEVTLAARFLKKHIPNLTGYAMINREQTDRKYMRYLVNPDKSFIMISALAGVLNSQGGLRVHHDSDVRGHFDVPPIEDQKSVVRQMHSRGHYDAIADSYIDGNDVITTYDMMMRGEEIESTPYTRQPFSHHMRNQTQYHHSYQDYISPAWRALVHEVNEAKSINIKDKK